VRFGSQDENTKICGETCWMVSELTTKETGGTCGDERKKSLSLESQPAEALVNVCHNWINWKPAGR
jgi:hypothetical protein